LGEEVRGGGALETELARAREQQAAVAAVMRTMSAAPTDLDATLDAILTAAVRLCRAAQGYVYVLDGDVYRMSRALGTDKEFEAWQSDHPLPIGDRGKATTRAALLGKPLHIPDVLKDPEYTYSEAQERGNIRASLSVPLVKDGIAVAVLAMWRNTPEPFTEEEIALVSTFADQALIAFENVSLASATKDTFEQQFATSAVLQAITAASTDLRPVFQVIVDQAVRLCAADMAGFWLRDGDEHVVVATAGRWPNVAGEGQQVGDRAPIYPANTLIDRAMLDRRTFHLPQMSSEDARTLLRPELSREQWLKRYGPNGTEVGWGMARLAVPVIRDGAALGTIRVARNVEGPFSPRQVQLVESFATQAAIAIENVRLAKETKDSLDRQTAISEILGVMSHSPEDVQPVLDVIAKSARRYCGAEDAMLIVAEHGRIVANAHDGNVAWVAGIGDSIDRSLPAMRAIVDREIVHLPDLQGATDGEWTRARDIGIRYGIRTVLSMPLLHSGEAVGSMTLRRQEQKPFTDSEIALLRTFAEQAVIAIGNVRNFNETKASLERQTALSEVLRVIAASPTDVQPVLDAIAQSAARFCGAIDVSVRLVRGEDLSVVAHHGPHAEGAVIKIDRTAIGGRAVLERRTIYVADIQAPEGAPFVQSRARLAGSGIRGLLASPLLREDVAIGVIVLRTTDTTGFDARQVQLVEAFARQAVIAIENVRLFNETKESLDRQTAISDVLRTISGTVFDLEPTLRAVVQNAARLVGADLAWMSRRVYVEAAASFTPPGTARWARTPELEALFSRVTPDVPPRVALPTGSLMSRLISTGESVNFIDIQQEPELVRSSPTVNATGARSVLGVVVRSEDAMLGAFVLARLEVKPFSERDLQLAETFADQAAIAIKNVELFNEIQAKSRELEAANRHKSEFLANMSHELRTPLNAIIGFSEVLGQGIFGEVNGKQKEYLEDILSSGKHLLSLINDILDLSKVEAGRMELERSTFSVAAALESGLTIVRERASRHGISLRAALAPDLPHIEADERKVKQILYNLLSNAVKFTPDGGRVEVSARAENGDVRIDVTDTGIGIAPADQARIFEEFRQVGRERSREGTGLGLTLTKKYVELHGGRLWVESTPGKGSTFSFTLPLMRPAAEAGAHGRGATS
jgi:signal transduction histidine kinase